MNFLYEHKCEGFPADTRQNKGVDCTFVTFGKNLAGSQSFSFSEATEIE